MGYDDKIREITANKFAWVYHLSVDIRSIFGCNLTIEQADLRSTDSKPKGVASTDDGTVFVVTADGVEVYYGGSDEKNVADL